MNYEKSKSELSIVSDYINSNGLIKQSEYYYNRYLSQESLKAYSACLASKSDAPLYAWLLNVGDNTFVVCVKAGAAAKFKGVVSVIGGGGVEREDVEFDLSGSSEDIFAFPYNKKFDVDIIVKGSSENGLKKSIYIYLPREIKLVIERWDDLERSVSMGIRAGGNGSTSYAPSYDNVSIVADPGSYIDEASVRQGLVQYLSPPMRPTWIIKSTFLRDDAGGVVRVDVRAENLEGTNSNAQSGAIIPIVVNQYRLRVVERD